MTLTTCNGLSTELVQGRKKRQAEELAKEIFGKGRRSSAPPSGPKAGLGGSLASRVGVNKVCRQYNASFDYAED